MKFLAWLISVIFAFSLGAESNTAPSQSDEELKNRVQQHIDTIVDESAAIVDDVTDAIRSDEYVQETEQFIQDVQDIAEQTASDLSAVVESTKTRIEEKFGTEEAEKDEAVPETDASVDGEAAPETDASVDGEAVPATEVSVDGEAVGN